jgi:hypothetical protein
MIFCRRRSTRVSLAILLNATWQVELPSAVIDRRYRLFADYRDRNLSPMWGAAMLEQENTLPGSKLHFAVDNRDCLACARQSHADVRRHVITAFRTVSKVISIFRHQTIEKFLQVMSRRRIGVFHENDAATRVLNKHRDCPTAQAALVDLRLDIVGDFVGPFASSANVELILVSTHRILENNTGGDNSRALTPKAFASCRALPNRLDLFMRWVLITCMLLEITSGLIAEVSG